jgi:AraC-like DNA-binding protein
MRSTNNMLDDVWHVQIFKVQEGVYESIDLQNVMFPYWVLSFIVDGRVEVTDGAKAQFAHSGQVMLHAPGVPFHEKALNPGRHVWMLLQVSNRFQVDLFRLFPVNEVFTVSNPESFADLMYSLLNAWKKEESTFRELELSGLGLQLVHRLLSDWDASGRPSRSLSASKKDDRLHVVMNVLNESISEKITRQTLAESVHLNPNYLDKLFFEKYQMYPMQMLRELRLKKAKGLLENSDLSLADISGQCGLGDASYLSHQFQKRYGITPGKHREKARLANQAYIGPSMSG